LSDMNNKVALITGASSGIGRATAELFAEKGARVVVAAIESDGGTATAIQTDWDQVLNINLKGTFLGMQYQAGAMLAAGNGGAIVNVGSVNSFLGFATGAAYCTSKHGLIGLTTSVSAELASQGIRVNLVCPGIVDAPMHQRLRRDMGDAVYDQGVLPSVHLKRAGQPEEIARAIVFLCSEEASYITGTTLTPDGGLTLTV
jgi:NAD(P)-dependent dehydrogenase (short-subunit alcohol dehydrogenase family)